MFCCYPLVLSLLVLIRISEGHLYAKGPTSSRSGFSPFSTWTWVHTWIFCIIKTSIIKMVLDGWGQLVAVSKNILELVGKDVKKSAHTCFGFRTEKRKNLGRKCFHKLVCLHLKRSSLLDGGWNWRFLPDFISRSGWNNCHLLLQNISK